MINTVKVTNYLGDAITISLADPSSSGFAVSSITGLGPVKANINTTEVATNDGSIYNSARLDPRNIVLDIIFYGSDIETLRQKTYKYFPIKKQLTLEFDTDHRQAMINGYVESNEPNIFSRSENTRISIVCPNPYFYSVAEESQITLFSGVTPEFEFEFENQITGYISETKRIFVPMEFGGFTTAGAANTQTTRIRSLTGWGISCDRPITVTPPTGFKSELAVFSSEAMRQSDFIEFSGWTESKYTYSRSGCFARLMGAKSSNETISSSEKSFFESNVKVERVEIKPEPTIEFSVINQVTDANIYYNGDAEVGVSILIHATGPIENIGIYKTDTRESMLIDTNKIEALTGSGIVAGDDILICTVKGKKSIKLHREGREHNILNALNRNASWFQLAKGDNTFAYSAEAGINYLQFRVENDTLFEGI